MLDDNVSGGRNGSVVGGNMNGGAWGRVKRGLSHRSVEQDGLKQEEKQRTGVRDCTERVRGRRLGQRESWAGLKETLNRENARRSTENERVRAIRVVEITPDPPPVLGLERTADKTTTLANGSVAV